jgi:hypothetical protein
MFSKEASKKLRQDFWISFGKSFPRKWLLYNTKIKGLAFRFHFDLKKAEVALEIGDVPLERRIELWEKVESLKTVMQETLPELVFEDYFILPNGKEISRAYLRLNGVCIHNKDTWQETMLFLKDNMDKMEGFFEDYQEVLRN